MKIAQKIKKEFYTLLPPFVFFLTAFLWINWLHTLMMRSYGGQGFSFSMVLIGSLVVAKVLLVMDHLSWINLFRKPLIYNVLWKTILYTTAVLVIRLLHHLIPHLAEADSFAIGYQRYKTSIDWPRFWAVQSWYFTIFLMFVTFRDCIRVIGANKLRQIFFQK